MRKTIYLPDELAARVEEYLKDHEGETLSSLVQEVLEQKVRPRHGRSILRLAGLVDVDTFEDEEKAARFKNHPEDQFYDRVD